MCTRYLINQQCSYTSSWSCFCWYLVVHSSRGVGLQPKILYKRGEALKTSPRMWSLFTPDWWSACSCIFHAFVAEKLLGLKVFSLDDHLSVMPRTCMWMGIVDHSCSGQPLQPAAAVQVCTGAPSGRLLDTWVKQQSSPSHIDIFHSNSVLLPWTLKKFAVHPHIKWCWIEFDTVKTDSWSNYNYGLALQHFAEAPPGKLCTNSNCKTARFLWLWQLLL